MSGVSWDNRKRKWQCHIGVIGQVKHLGYYLDKSDALVAVDFARQVMHGEFAKLNDPRDAFDNDADAILDGRIPISPAVQGLIKPTKD